MYIFNIYSDTAFPSYSSMHWAGRLLTSLSRGYNTHNVSFFFSVFDAKHLMEWHCNLITLKLTN